MQIKFYPLISAVLLSTIAPDAMARHTLRIGIAESDGPPIAIIADHKLVGGILKELGGVITKELNVEPKFVVLSRKRIDLSLKRNHIHMICNAHESWEYPNQNLSWSIDLYPQIERIISLDTLPDINNIADLKGKTIGIIHGFHYPTLQPILESGGICHSNNPSHHLAVTLQLVKKQICDVAIATDLEFAYWARQHPEEAKQLKQHPLVISTVPTKCAIKNHAPITINALNKAIKKFKRSNAFKKLIKTGK